MADVGQLNSAANDESGAASENTAVCGSGASTDEMPAYDGPYNGPAFHISAENATSAEVTGVPSLNAAPSCKVTVTVIASGS